MSVAVWKSERLEVGATMAEKIAAMRSASSRQSVISKKGLSDVRASGPNAMNAPPRDSVRFW